MQFLLGILASLVAGAILIAISKISLRWPFPRGLQFVDPNRDKYIKDISTYIRSNRRRFFFKCFTGFDLFSSDITKRAFEETRFDNWQQLLFIFTDPASAAFQSEPNKDYSQDRLSGLQGTVTDFLNKAILPNSRKRDFDTRKGICSLPEDKNFFNLLIFDEVAFVFFRGFTEEKGPSGQLILKINLAKCPRLVKELIEFIEQYYIGKCNSQLRAGHDA